MSEASLVPASRNQVRQHNVLTTAHYSYTKLQMDLMIFLLSKLRNSQDDLVYLIPVKELDKATGNQHNYTYLQEATEDMGSRVFKVKNGNRYEQIWMFQKVAYLDGEGMIEMTLSSTILPYLFDLKNNFTSYEIAAFLKLNSMYAKRIYPLCSQWKDKEATPVYDILQLKGILGIWDEKENIEGYPVFGDFNARVLQPSIKAINEVTDLEISLVTEKKGRAIKAVGFTVKQKPRALDADSSPAGTLSLPESITQAQFDNANRILTEYHIVDQKIRGQIFASPDMIRQVNKFAFDLKQDRVKATSNPAGLLLTVLGLVDAKKKPSTKSTK
ncbi:replication initiation protein [Hymenobacter sp. DG01]|uniref:replication initiation protein n=1 Tax=Hymenobacter sp. DG01 TaxID=2584940 RepID=UPI001122571C|nr:replication initiation protein [Hymenobacter sp. DG01]